jgi:hypothetical protein
MDTQKSVHYGNQPGVVPIIMKQRSVLIVTKGVSLKFLMPITSEITCWPTKQYRGPVRMVREYR